MAGPATSPHASRAPLQLDPAALVRGRAQFLRHAGIALGVLVLLFALNILVKGISPYYQRILILAIYFNSYRTPIGDPIFLDTVTRIQG